MLLSTRKEEITDTCVNMDEFHKSYIEQKKLDPKENIHVFHLYKVQKPAN